MRLLEEPDHLEGRMRVLFDDGPDLVLLVAYLELAEERHGRLRFHEVAVLGIEVEGGRDGVLAGVERASIGGVLRAQHHFVRFVAVPHWRCETKCDGGIQQPRERALVLPGGTVVARWRLEGCLRGVPAAEDVVARLARPFPLGSVPGRIRCQLGLGQRLGLVHLRLLPVAMRALAVGVAVVIMDLAVVGLLPAGVVAVVEALALLEQRVVLLGIELQPIGPAPACVAVVVGGGRLAAGGRDGARVAVARHAALAVPLLLLPHGRARGGHGVAEAPAQVVEDGLKLHAVHLD